MNKSSTRYFSSKQEKAVAKTIGGRKVANSGATMFSKGDVSTENILIECKTKTKPSDSITVKREWIEKNEEEAFEMGKQYSAVCFNFGDIHYPENYYIISEKMFLQLVGVLNGKDN